MQAKDSISITQICKAETIKVEHSESSYGIFCFNEIGDLFLNSDWGSYQYTWRSFDGNFKSFLKKCNPQYIVEKFCINYTELTKKSLTKDRIKHLENLVSGLIVYCQTT